VLIVAAMVTVGVWWWIGARGEKPAPSGDHPSLESRPQAAALRSEDIERLVGRWVRTDFPYVIEIAGGSDDGTLQAAYYNPQPINVAHAEARGVSGRIAVFVELRDLNYPGSTYNLVYDPSTDALSGSYFQAVQRQSYDVAFQRMPLER
jgi:hypothetical protein